MTTSCFGFFLKLCTCQQFNVFPLFISFELLCHFNNQPKLQWGGKWTELLLRNPWIMQVAADPNTCAHHNDTGPRHFRHVLPAHKHYSGISIGLVMSMQWVHIFGLYLWGCKPLYLWNPSHDFQHNFHLWTLTHCWIGSVFTSYFASLCLRPFVVLWGFTVNFWQKPFSQ